MTIPKDDARIEKLKAAAAADVESMKKQTQEMVDSIFSFGELGFQETETHRYVVDILKKNGFKVEEGVAGIPTAFMATWGSGKPVIALGSDIDGIPQASQKPGVAYHDPLIEGAPGHGEGHNSGVPLNITAAIAVKKIMEREKLSGTIKVWPGTAEELVGTKAYFIRAGLFKDVDVALFAHVGSDLGVSWGDRDGTGLVSVEYSFVGETAHSAGAPWAQRARRRRVDEHRMELPARASAARASLALRGDRWRRSAERRAPHGVGLVLLPPHDLSAHQGTVGDRRQDGGRRCVDGRREVAAHASAGQRLAAAHEPRCRDGGA
jgi:metal-dependent amidase/aminoacylase/carboxypeptidase family protein